MAASAAVVLMSSSCLDTKSDAYDRVEPVRPGIYIYNAAHSQNDASMQPADIALRLAILRAEAVKQGKTDELGSVVLNGLNVKTLLFGMYTRIEEDAAEAGTYVIEYRNSGGQRPYDAYTRSGSVRVKTHGIGLEETDASNRWTVVLESSQLTVSGGSTITIASTGDTYLYRSGDAYAIGFDHAVSFEKNGSPKADWSGTFTLATDRKDGLAFSELAGASFELDGSASGTGFWSFNGTSGAGLRYEVSDGKYQPSFTGSATQIMGGTEICALTSSQDYDPAAYPSPEVQVEWSVVGNTIYYAVTYNGTTVNF